MIEADHWAQLCFKKLTCDESIQEESECHPPTPLKDMPKWRRVDVSESCFDFFPVDRSMGPAFHPGIHTTSPKSPDKVEEFEDIDIDEDIYELQEQNKTMKEEISDLKDQVEMLKNSKELQELKHTQLEEAHEALKKRLDEFLNTINAVQFVRDIPSN